MSLTFVAVVESTTLSSAVSMPSDPFGDLVAFGLLVFVDSVEAASWATGLAGCGSQNSQASGQAARIYG